MSGQTLSCQRGSMCSSIDSNSAVGSMCFRLHKRKSWFLEGNSKKNQRETQREIWVCQQVVSFFHQLTALLKFETSVFAALRVLSTVQLTLCRNAGGNWISYSFASVVSRISYACKIALALLKSNVLSDVKVLFPQFNRTLSQLSSLISTKRETLRLCAAIKIFVWAIRLVNLWLNQ